MDNEIHIPTPDELRDALQAPGRSQAELARRLGLDTSAVNRMTAGKRGIKAHELPIVLGYINGETTERINRTQQKIHIAFEGDLPIEAAMRVLAILRANRE